MWYPPSPGVAKQGCQQPGVGHSSAANWGPIFFWRRAAAHPGSVGVPGFRLHPLWHGRAEQRRIRGSGNRRVVGRFRDGQAVGVDDH